jgi:hypothetical protein
MIFVWPFSRFRPGGGGKQDVFFLLSVLIPQEVEGGLLSPLHRFWPLGA